MAFHPTLRLVPEIRPEIEWTHLVNETLIGEKAIVPLLYEILQSELDAPILMESLKRQFDEEVDHVRLYFQQVGTERIEGSGYDVKLKEYVRRLPNTTLKLFALQGMLEGIALGALDYRLQAWGGSPSFQTDRKAMAEELGHVECSFPAFRELVRREGALSPEAFKQVSRDVNSFFVSSFNGKALADLVQSMSGEQVDADQIEATPAMKHFRRQSAQTLVRTKSRFLSKYIEAVRDVANG